MGTKRNIDDTSPPEDIYLLETGKVGPTAQRKLDNIHLEYGLKGYRHPDKSFDDTENILSEDAVLIMPIKARLENNQKAFIYDDGSVTYYDELEGKVHGGNLNIEKQLNNTVGIVNDKYERFKDVHVGPSEEFINLKEKLNPTFQMEQYGKFERDDLHYREIAPYLESLDARPPQDQVFTFSDIESSLKKYPGLPVDRNVVEAIGVGNTRNKEKRLASDKNVNDVFPHKITNGSNIVEDQYLIAPRIKYDQEQQLNNRLLNNIERRRMAYEQRHKQQLENDELSFDSPVASDGLNRDDTTAFDSQSYDPRQQVENNDLNRDDTTAFDSQSYDPRQQVENNDLNRDDTTAFDSQSYDPRQQVENNDLNRDDTTAFDSQSYDPRQQVENNDLNRDDTTAFDSQSSDPRQQMENNSFNGDDTAAFDSQSLDPRQQVENNNLPRDDMANFDVQNEEDNNPIEQIRDSVKDNNSLSTYKDSVKEIFDDNRNNDYEQGIEDTFNPENKDNGYEQGVDNVFNTGKIDDSTEQEVDKIFSGEYSKYEFVDNSDKDKNKKDNSLDNMVSNTTDSIKSIIPLGMFGKDDNKSKNNKEINNKENNDTEDSIEQNTPDINQEIEKSLSSEDMTKVTNEQLLNQFVDDVKKYDATTEEQLKERAEAYDNALRTNALFRKQVACGYVIRKDSDNPEKPLYPSQEKAIKDKVNNIYDLNNNKNNESKNNTNENNEDDILKNIRKNLNKKKDELNSENKGIDDESIRNKLQQLSEQNRPQQEDDGFDDNPKAMAGKMRGGRGKRFRGKGVDLNTMNNPRQQPGTDIYLNEDESMLETGVLALMRKKILESNGIDPSKTSYQTSNSVWA